jgi:hypothetical protein
MVGVVGAGFGRHGKGMKRFLNCDWSSVNRIRFFLCGELGRKANWEGQICLYYLRYSPVLFISSPGFSGLTSHCQVDARRILFCFIHRMEQI